MMSNSSSSYVRLPPNLSRNLLFYSKHCHISSIVIGAIRRTDTRSRFLFVCIDGRQASIPSCVDSVPMIITSDAGIIRGESDIIDFVASAKDAVVEPVDSDLMTASDLSREYESMSFLDDGAHNSQMSTSSCRFLSLDAIDPVSGGFPAISSSQQHFSAAASSVVGNGGGDVIDQMVRERDIEAKQFQQQCQS